MTTNTTYNTAASTAVTFSFAMDSVTVNGKVYPVEHSVTQNETVYAFVTVESEQDEAPAKVLRIRFVPIEDYYDAALVAARDTCQDEHVEPEQEPNQSTQAQTSTTSEQQEQAQQPAQDASTQEQRPAMRKPCTKKPTRSRPSPERAGAGSGSRSGQAGTRPYPGKGIRWHVDQGPRLAHLV